MLLTFITISNGLLVLHCSLTFKTFKIELTRIKVTLMVFFSSFLFKPKTSGHLSLFDMTWNSWIVHQSTNDFNNDFPVYFFAFVQINKQMRSTFTFSLWVIVNVNVMHAICYTVFTYFLKQEIYIRFSFLSSSCFIQVLT